MRLKQLNPYLLQLAGLPVCVITTGLLVGAWYWLAPVKSFEVHIANSAYALLGLAGGFIGLFVLHELLHCVGHPGWGFSPSSILGFWPSRFMPYAAFLGPIPRNRFILVGFMPLLVLSVLPLAVCAVFSIHSLALSAVSVMNCLVSCGDIIICLLVWMQVSPPAIVQEQGWDIWWKLPEDAPSALQP